MDKAIEKTRARKKDARLIRDLLIGVIDIFNMLTSVYVFRSTINWPRIIHDAETLNRLNIIMLTKLVEIQLNLSQKLLPSIGVVYTYNILSNISGWRIIQHDPIFKKFNLEKEKSHVIEKIGLERLYRDPYHKVLLS
ncbi:MAG TPA: hypothetical protein VJ729_10635 [Nitrososphaeraceae archaeon]|nr:hypothetical protein [Nitrososphaeraceae archaeon]